MSSVSIGLKLYRIFQPKNEICNKMLFLPSLMIEKDCYGTRAIYLPYPIWLWNPQSILSADSTQQISPRA